MPSRGTPKCPKCGGTYVRLWLPGPSVEVLVDAARPAAGVLAALVHSDDWPSPAGDPMLVLCAVCEQDCGKYPRQHGHPLHQAAVPVTEDGPWLPAREWQVQDLRTDYFGTALQQLIDAYEETLTGEEQYRYGRGRDDPPGRGAPEKGGQGVDHEASGDGAARGGEGVDHPLTVDDALQAVRDARDAEARALERLGEALRTEHAAGAGKRELGRRADGVMSLPLVRRALAEGGQRVDHPSAEGGPA
ncbi:hypothetical protein [Streptomyces sp. H27-C3]|uniref:hypothetical protein n=1 Tax=Streptomyces sp. H27-C3 TaxID=3046305 RepID=UPI0024BADDDB|nr:hypothetical protein [Streptomyces sp. H27-C3]MDJ0464950.1 hypothetical protein [Streptomyces sp. H27-C3]